MGHFDSTDHWLIRACQSAFSWYGYQPERKWPGLSRTGVEKAQRRTRWFAGVNGGSHNAGAALVRVQDGEATLLLNAEEERWSRRKHEWGYPEQAIEALIETLRAHGAGPESIDVVTCGWDFGAFAAHFSTEILRGLPRSLGLLRDTGMLDAGVIRSLPKRLARRLGRKDTSIITVPHHDAHAWGSLMLSPFHGEELPVLILVADGMGDRSSMSVYLANDGHTPELVDNHKSLFDSLGLMYQVLSSTQGGWTPLSSEGRYMGAAAWGAQTREQNSCYERLRPLLSLLPGGRIELNRRWMRWHQTPSEPYGAPLREVLGEPLRESDLWNPDAVLDPDRLNDSSFTRERLDRAAAVQRLFEDGVAHVLDHWLAATGARRFVWTGGTALNCVASLSLMERYADRGIELWVPPFPGDNGIAAGSALRLAWKTGLVKHVRPLEHAFLGGGQIQTADIESAVRAAPVSVRKVPSNLLGDFIAERICDGEFIGLAQGNAESGPRALGHRSILADPTRRDTLERLNQHVKRRERIRPLAPVITADAARELFDLPPGSDHHNLAAWRWMVLCARARKGTADKLPAVVHVDGTSRLQVVDPLVDPLMDEILRGIQLRKGVPAAVNTSLNVGEPLAHTPRDVVQTLLRARDMRSAVLVAEDGMGWIVERS